MTNKLGTTCSARDAREPFWRGTEADRALLSPDQEFETSGHYRQPPDDWADPKAPAQGGFRGRGPKGYTRTDARIREDVCERLSWDEEVDASEIEVKVENGEVILEGRVATRPMKQLAEDLAQRVPGVIDVRNAIRVKPAADG